MGKFFLGQAWCHMPVVTTTQEVQTGGLQIQNQAGQLTGTVSKYNKTVVEYPLSMCKARAQSPVIVVCVCV